MLKPILVFLILLLAAGVQAQSDEDDSLVFTTVEQMPEFPGGEKALLEYLGSIEYPPIAKDNDIQGNVYVKFIIEKDGAVGEVEVVKGADLILNNAALTHIQNMPLWKPGWQNGKEIRVQFIVPIKFILLDPEPAKEDDKKKRGDR